MISQKWVRRDWKIALSLVLSVAVLNGGLGLAIAEQPGTCPGVVEAVTTEDGNIANIDWSEKGVIRAVGKGLPDPTDEDPISRREGTKIAAKGVARRNLLELVGGIHIDSQTTIKNFMLEQDVIKQKIEGTLLNSRITNLHELDDGSWEATAEMKWKGWLQGTIPNKPSRPKPISSFKPEYNVDQEYTGLVVVASGLCVQPAMYPKILMEDGQVVYGAEYVTEETMEDLKNHNEGLVGYMPSTHEAKSHDRVTANPFVVKALKAAGKSNTDLVISDSDAQIMHVIPKHMDILKKARVLIVLD